MLIVLIALFSAAIVAPVIVTTLGRRGFYVMAAVLAAALIWFLANWPHGTQAHTSHTAWIPRLNMDLTLRLDTLSAVLVALVLGVGALVLCYCAEYFTQIRRRVAIFAGELTAFAAAMVGLVISDNILAMFVFWELTTVLSFLLVGFYATRATSRRAATQALLVTTAGGLCLLVGAIWLGELAGTYNLSDIVAAAPRGWESATAVALILIGALSKSAIVPTHFWLPGAMAAPTPVSAYLHAAAMVKAGIYLVARLAPGFADTTSWRVLVLGLGAFTMLLGGWRSLRERDLKLILAFGTVSQLGFLMVLVGAGTPEAALAGVAMLVAHALFKSTLFMVVGIIDHSTGTRDIRRLARLGAASPTLLVIAAVAAASMAGVPPTAGFVGKEAALGALSHEHSWYFRALLVVVVVGSIITFSYSTRFIWGAFGRKLQAKPSRAVAEMHRPTVAFIAPAAILTVAGVVAGLAATPLGHVYEHYADTVGAEHLEEHLALWHGFTLPLLLSAVVIVGGVLMYLVVRRRPQLTAGRSTLGNADRIYDAILRGADVVSVRITGFTQRGSLPLTQATIFATVIVVPTVVLFIGSRNTLQLKGFDNAVQLIVGAVMVSGALATALLRNRLAGALIVGITGYCNGLLFALYGAPDLALTQFLTETLTIVIFVLVLRKLPAETEPRMSTGFKPVRALLGLAVGTSVVLLGLFAAAARHARAVAEAIPDAAYEYGHGKNAVNVLLVDIRAWDTLGEVSVLVVAATGVASLVFRNSRWGVAPRASDALADLDDPDDLPDTDRTAWLAGSHFRDPKHRSLVLESTTRLIFPTMMVLSVYFFFAGHNAPGGGFAGGLTAGMALVLRYLAGGRYELGETIRIDAGRILGAGLGLSVLTAVISVIAGSPALSSTVWELHLPVFGAVKIVSALFFDAGVYLIVVGLVLDVLRSLGARLDQEPRRYRNPLPPETTDAEPTRTRVRTALAKVRR